MRAEELELAAIADELLAFCKRHGMSNATVRAIPRDAGEPDDIDWASAMAWRGDKLAVGVGRLSDADD